MRTGHSNPFFKIATAEAHDYDWVILGASHAMPLDFADFNAQMQRETGLRILNLAAPGTGPLYNRFVLEHFLRAHRTRNLLYVVDSFAFYSRTWNEDRFADAKLSGARRSSRRIARLLWDYVRHDGVDPRALLDYLSGFSKINNRERFQRDVWEGEAQFDRVYRSSATAVAKRIAYLYPDATTPDVRARYLKRFADLIAIAREHGIRVIAVKLPLPALFRDQTPQRGGVRRRGQRRVLTRAGGAASRFFRCSGQPEFLLRHRPFEPRRGYRVVPAAIEAAAHDTGPLTSNRNALASQPDVNS